MAWGRHVKLVDGVRGAERCVQHAGGEVQPDPGQGPVQQQDTQDFCPYR